MPANLCGAYTHELYDVTTGSPLALDAGVFPSEDLVSSTKSLSVATTDFAKAQVYTLRLKVFYTDYSATVDE